MIGESLQPNFVNFSSTTYYLPSSHEVSLTMFHDKYSVERQYAIIKTLLYSIYPEITPTLSQEFSSSLTKDSFFQSSKVNNAILTLSKQMKSQDQLEYITRSKLQYC